MDRDIEQVAKEEEVEVVPVHSGVTPRVQVFEIAGKVVIRDGNITTTVGLDEDEERDLAVLEAVVGGVLDDKPRGHVPSDVLELVPAVVASNPVGLESLGNEEARPAPVARPEGEQSENADVENPRELRGEVEGEHIRSDEADHGLPTELKLDGFDNLIRAVVLWVKDGGEIDHSSLGGGKKLGVRTEGSTSGN